MSETSLYSKYNETNACVLTRASNGFEDDLYLNRIPHRGFTIQLADSTIITSTEYPLVDCPNFTIPLTSLNNVKLASSSNSDTGALLLVIYLDAKYSTKITLVVCNGTTAVNLNISDFFRFVNLFMLTKATSQINNYFYRNIGKIYVGDAGNFSTTTGFPQNYGCMRIGLNVAGCPLVVVPDNYNYQLVDIKYNNLTNRNVICNLYFRNTPNDPFVYVNEEALGPYEGRRSTQAIGGSLQSRGYEFLYTAYTRPKIDQQGQPETQSGAFSIQKSAKTMNKAYYLTADF